jgi:O-antigen chain-terminating methyltransferase
VQGQRWRLEQRRLREALRVERRSADGRSAIVADGNSPAAHLKPPDLLDAPLAPAGSSLAPFLTPARRLLQRLLSRPVLQPQSLYNREVADELAAQRRELERVGDLLDQLRGSPDVVQFDNFGFAQRFRGDEQELRSRQVEYVEYFAGRGEILDVGCGRGEFLTLLRERGVSARGVDLDEQMVAACRERGLDVEHADALDYLERQPDGLFGGVFMAQVVEHLATDELVALLGAIRRKSGEDAVLVIETINPESLPVLMRWFWLDPTHVRLLHPETLQYFVEQAGFDVRSVQFRKPVSEAEQLPTLELEGVAVADLERYNESVARVNARLFGPLDYFVVASG